MLLEGTFEHLAVLVWVLRRVRRGRSEAESMAASLIWDILWRDAAFAGNSTVLPANLC